MSMVLPKHFPFVLGLKSLTLITNPAETRSLLTSSPAVSASSKLRDAVNERKTFLKTSHADGRPNGRTQN